MSESKKRLTESVSALVDGEVSELELHRILKELELETANQSEHNDQGIAGKWSRIASSGLLMGLEPGSLDSDSFIRGYWQPFFWRT